MKIRRKTAVPRNAGAVLPMLACLAAQAAEGGFLEDAKTDLVLRNYYFNRDFRDHDAGKSLVDEWAAAGELPDAAPPTADGAVVADRRGLDRGARARLARALDAWWGTPLRERALSAATVVPELPFFSAEDGGASGYVTGSIDLFSSDGDGRALVVDYKTGETYMDEAAAAEHHAMQARYYAHVLMAQGYREVEVAFVLVENLRDGSPLTVSFPFAGEVPPLGADVA